MTLRLSLTVNGCRREVAADPRLLLVHLLRDGLGLTGTHVGCLTGDCGACTVLLDGSSVKSCSILAASADGAEVTTVEGLAEGRRLHSLQQAFWDEFGFQCGFCLPGMLLTTYELLQHSPDPNDEAMVDAINGNLCRCTGYQTILRAMRVAADRMRQVDEGG